MSLLNVSSSLLPPPAQSNTRDETASASQEGRKRGRGGLPLSLPPLLFLLLHFFSAAALGKKMKPGGEMKERRERLRCSLPLSLSAPPDEIVPLLPPAQFLPSSSLPKVSPLLIFPFPPLLHSPFFSGPFHKMSIIASSITVNYSTCTENNSHYIFQRRLKEA